LAGEKAITERLGALPLSYTNLRSRVWRQVLFPVNDNHNYR
jgi:hypothetical protein